jgi:hypothetical protein
MKIAAAENLVSIICQLDLVSVNCAILAPSETASGKIKRHYFGHYFAEVDLSKKIKHTSPKETLNAHTTFLAANGPLTTAVYLDAMHDTVSF